MYGMTPVKTTRCIDCDGEGTLETERACPDPIRGGELVGVVVECWYCDGTGEFTDYYAEEDDLDG
jgi:DnaJ-class molecular chaperone